MRLNKLYNKYSEDEGVEELVKTYNMKLRSDFLSFCQSGVVVSDVVQFTVSGVRIGTKVEILIRIRISIKTMPIHYIAFR